MPLRTITGTILSASGDPIVGGVVSFTMLDRVYLTDPDETYVTSGVSTTTDANGDFSIEVAAGLPTLWQVKLPGNDNFVISVPEGAATTVEFLRAAYNGQAPDRVPGVPPTVTDFTNMQHTHLATASGGALPDAALGSGTAADEAFLGGDRTWKYVQPFDVRNYASVEATIVAANAAGGGEVILQPADYTITDDLDILSNVAIVGAGMGLTTLLVDGNFNGIQGASRNHIAIRDLTIDCTDQTGGSGIELNTCTDFHIERVEVLNAFGNGISLGGSGTSDPNQLRGTITGCIIRSPGNHGVSLANGTWWTTVSDNQAFDTVESGFNISSSHYCTVSNNIAYNETFSATPGYGGVRLSNSTEHCTVTGNTIYGFERGVFVASTAGAGNVVTGNTIHNINLQGILIEVSDAAISGNMLMDCYDSASGAAIELSGAQRVTVGVNTITDTRTPKQHTFGVRESNAANNNVIAQQVVSGYLNAPFQIIGAGSKGPVGVVDADATASTVANTTGAQLLTTAAYTFPANTLRVGSVIRFRAAGVYGTAAAAPTLRLRLLGEAVAFGDSSAQTCTASLTNRGWDLEVVSIVTALGASGTIESQGLARMNNAVNSSHFWDLENTSAGTFDTTADIDVTLVAIWGTADAANTITLRQWTVEVLH